VDVEPVAAYVSHDSPLELTVNFGIFAGRDSSRADIDRLGEMLLAFVPGATLFSGHRYEFARGAAEATASEVKIRFPLVLPTEKGELEPLIDMLLETARRWVRDCAATPPPEGEDLAARIARTATES
jgi:hypothetical protein